MKERGMIFNDEMVRAILDNRKTQTRRIMAPQPADDIKRGAFPNPNFIGWISSLKHKNGGTTAHSCPFGQPGDRIWVRETFSCIGNEDGHPVDANGNLCEREHAQRIYRASAIQKPNNYGLWTSQDGFDFEGGWTPSIHMPRWASRILLEITDLRVERLHDMSEEDAKAEGASPATYKITPPEAVYRVGFGDIWRSIYGEENWLSNPWVWVIEFKRIDGDTA
jgi:hypothetical protein